MYITSSQTDSPHIKEDHDTAEIHLYINWDTYYGFHFKNTIMMAIITLKICI